MSFRRSSSAARSYIGSVKCAVLLNLPEPHSTVPQEGMSALEDSLVTAEDSNRLSSTEKVWILVSLKAATHSPNEAPIVCSVVKDNT